MGSHPHHKIQKKMAYPITLYFKQEDELFMFDREYVLEIFDYNIFGVSPTSKIVGYDAHGFPLDIQVTEVNKKRFFGLVSNRYYELNIAYNPEMEIKTEEFRKLLVDYLSAQTTPPIDKKLAGMDGLSATGSELDDIVNRALDYAITY